jgi:formamidopyrimidine-DNA glycosylase
MPELPDVVVYVEALEQRILGATLDRVSVLSPFLLRTAVPPLEVAHGRRVQKLRRMGKRIVIALDGPLHLVLHLMIAGRLRWLAAAEKPPGRITLAVFAFSTGRLALTEAGTRRRAALHVVDSEAALEQLDPGGLEVLDADAASFAQRLRRDRHTLKRALTDPHLFSGIGNAYSDEILHRARLSPFALTQTVTDAQVQRLYQATCATLQEWTARLRQSAGAEFPREVTAFRPEMAVHGKYGQPCPVCGAPVQRIVYAQNETNYCARCQTGGRILADRALSRLLKASWPRDVDEL